MHELPILRDIVTVALKHAERAGAERVAAVDLTVGELRDLNEVWMQRYFDFVTAGTPAEGATLRVTRSRALFECHSCSATFGFDIRAGGDVSCDRCHTRDVELITGNELLIDSIDVA